MKMNTTMEDFFNNLTNSPVENEVETISTDYYENTHSIISSHTFQRSHLNYMGDKRVVRPLNENKHRIDLYEVTSFSIAYVLTNIYTNKKQFIEIKKEIVKLNGKLFVKIPVFQSIYLLEIK
jgi:hypothetical protein